MQDIFNVLSWNGEEPTIAYQETQVNRNTNINQSFDERGDRREKRVTFNEEQRRGQSRGSEKSPGKNVIHETHKRPKSAVKRSKLEKNMEEEM